MALGLLSVDKIESLGFNLAIDKGADGTREDFFGERVLVGMA